jgi:hypothetical protein
LCHGNTQRNGARKLATNRPKATTMTTRRDLLRASALAAATPALAGCGAGDYDEAARATWRHADAPPADAAALRLELVRYATLAANSHNSQPWRFSLAPDRIVIAPDFTRRTPVVDPDDHHLWVSLGCALENLVLAAAAFGLRAEPAFERGAIAVRLAPIAPTRSLLFDAIPQRQCTRTEYDGKPLAADELRQLASAGSGAGVNVLLLTDRMRVDGVLDWVLRGCSAQMRDPNFVLELKRWIRFGDADALATRDGLAARASGNPSLPRWVGSLLFGFVFTEGAEKDRYAVQLRSSSGVAVFVAERAEPAHWIEVGRAYQRFALLATALGVRNAFVNPPVEVPALREPFARWLGIGATRPDLVVRFGRGPVLPPSLRRPPQAVVVDAATLRA